MANDDCPDGHDWDDAYPTDDPSEAILCECYIDWCWLECAVGIVEHFEKPPPGLLKERTIDILAKLSYDGLIVLGDYVDGEGGFVPWNLPPSLALAKLRDLWEIDGRGHLGPYEVCWMANTAEGNRRAREISKLREW